MQVVEQHDGTTIALRKLAADYDVHDRRAATGFLLERAEAGEIVLGAEMSRRTGHRIGSSVPVEGWAGDAVLLHVELGRSAEVALSSRGEADVAGTVALDPLDRSRGGVGLRARGTEECLAAGLRATPAPASRRI